MAISESRPHIAEGLPFPLGATWDGLGVNVALFSAHATKVELCLFETLAGKNCIEWSSRNLRTRSGMVIWLRRRREQFTAIASTDPMLPRPANRFNPHKLLLDPYAKALVGSLRWGPELFGYTLGATGDDISYDELDSAPLMPKCRVVDPCLHLGS
jgi:glycogen operon protein